MIKFSVSKKVWKGGSQVRQYLQKNVILENTIFFEKIINLISYKKDYIDVCCQTPLSPQNGHVHL